LKEASRLKLIDSGAVVKRISDAIAVHLKELKGEICPQAGERNSYERGAVDGLMNALKYIEEVATETPRLLSPEEVRTMKAGTPLVVERFIKHNEKIVPMACWAINTGSLILSFHGTMFPDTVNEIPYKTIVQNREGKGHHTEYFRFWSDRPTNEQMAQEAWNGVEGDGC
jgi:hypothetical protein